MELGRPDPWSPGGGYTDRAAVILAETDGVPTTYHHPIARMRDGEFELDLVLRNNLTTEEHPLGLYHPTPNSTISRRRISGLIEVMGLAVLPARLKDELAAVADAPGDRGGPAGG